MRGPARPAASHRGSRAAAARAIGTVLRLALPVALVVCARAAPLAGQGAERPGDVAGAFRDPGAALLVARARDARDRRFEGLGRYEGLLRERLHVGLAGHLLRRERALFDQERVARIRWSAGGERAVRWIAARRAVPIVGADTRPNASRTDSRLGAEIGADMADELPADLLRSPELPPFVFDPSGERLALGERWALHPLADTALAHYRYASGDTLRIGLPDGEVALLEVRVEPRRADFHLVAGSLWFDRDTGALVRASYRPARPFDLAVDEPEDAGDVPFFLRPVEAEISSVTVEYSLHEGRYWLPRRFALEGEARLGSFARIPLGVEWTVGEYRLDEEATEVALTGPLPPGWSRSERRVPDGDGSFRYVTVVVPPADSLLTSPELSRDLGRAGEAAFGTRELDRIRRDLEGLLPVHDRFRPRLAWGLDRGLLRYNRVEGLSAGVATTLSVARRTTFELEGRLGSADPEPSVRGRLARRSGRTEWRLDAYHALTPMNEWSDPFTLRSSMLHVLAGEDHGEYYRATGVSLGPERSGRRLAWEVAAFHERQRPVERETDFYLLDFALDERVDSVLAAERVTVRGLRGVLRGFRGIDPNGWILTGELRGTAAWGDADYRRLSGSLATRHPILPGRLLGGLEVGGGAAWGGKLPVQAEHFLGGSATLRGFHDNERRGEAFWRLRGEASTGFPGARLVLFSDAGWVGPRGAVSLDAAVAVGGGMSFLDGLVRVDVARAVRDASRWRLHVYFGGPL